MKIKKFFCILGNHFIGRFNGILHVLILLVYPEKLKPLLLLNIIRLPLYLHSWHIESKSIHKMRRYIAPPDLSTMVEMPNGRSSDGCLR